MKSCLLLSLLVLLTCCGQRPAAPARERGTVTPTLFRPPQPPAMLDGAERMQWFADHYWDAFDFASSASVRDSLRLGRLFAGWADLLGTLPPERACGAVARLTARMDGDSMVYRRFLQMAERCFYDPNSPFRNDELFIPVLEQMLSGSLSEAERLRPQALLRLALRNRPGRVAEDFPFRTDAGIRKHLHAVQADYLLLYFVNPDCPACRELTAALRASPMLNERIGRGTLKVLALYPDEDVQAWRRMRQSLPAAWIRGHDADHVVHDSERYDLKAIPSLYLLDAQKRVLAKDCSSVARIEETLYRAETEPEPEPEREK